MHTLTEWIPLQAIRSELATLQEKFLGYLMNYP